MNLQTYLAIGELVQAAAHQHGVVGPIQFTICPVHPSERESDSEMKLAIDNLPDPTAEHIILPMNAEPCDSSHAR